MSKILVTVLLVASWFLTSISTVQAQSVTALYRVAKIQHVYKLKDLECVESKKNVCKKNLHWRVYYQAQGKYVTPKKHQILIDENPPLIGSVTQLTIEIIDK